MFDLSRVYFLYKRVCNWKKHCVINSFNQGVDNCKRYGNMFEGHSVWLDLVILTKILKPLLPTQRTKDGVFKNLKAMHGGVCSVQMRIKADAKFLFGVRQKMA